MNPTFRFLAAWVALTTSACAARAQNRAASQPSDSEARSIESFQTHNPDWTVQLDDRGHMIAIKRWASLLREDIRGEVEPIVQQNATAFGAGPTDPSMRRVVDEPSHVRYESGGLRAKAIDARLRDGVLVIRTEGAD